MDFFSVIQQRRSIRRFTDEVIPKEVIRKALEAAVLAPNSSNVQTWDFYVVQTEETKKKLALACYNQSAARTAKALLVVVADAKLWRRSNPQLIKYVESIQAPAGVQSYYKRVVPLTYQWGFLNLFAPFKMLSSLLIGFFRPINRGPFTRRDIQEVCVKSAALACENFVLAMTAQGYATCMMEGFDEWRVKKLLKLKCSSKVVMVIGMGKEAPRGTWGPQFRIPIEQVIHEL